jgi:hypothetical protein
MRESDTDDRVRRHTGAAVNARIDRRMEGDFLSYAERIKKPSPKGSDGSAGTSIRSISLIRAKKPSRSSTLPGPETSGEPPPDETPPFPRKRERREGKRTRGGLSARR